jgi:hypothetical protein
MKTYTSPAIALRGDVVRETLSGKAISNVETSDLKPFGSSNLSFGL